VSWLFVVIWFWLLDSFELRGGLWVWLLPVLMTLWVNVHGGFLTGFVLLAIYLVGAAWQWLALAENDLDDLLMKLRAGNRARTLGVVSVLALAATFVNPHGWRLHAHIYGYLSNRFLMDHIDEFQSPNFHGVAERCFAGLLLLTLVALVIKNRQLRLSEGLLIVFAVFSGLYASRNIPVSSLLLALVVGPRLSSGISSWTSGRRARQLAVTQLQASPGRSSAGDAPAFLDRMGIIELNLYGHLWAVAALLATAWAVAHGGRLGPHLTMNADFDARRFPARAVDLLQKSNTVPEVLSPDYWGGYVIYRLYPKVRVVVDDRHDLYGEQFLKSYLKLMRVEPGWEELLRDNHIQCVLTPTGSALNNILALQGEWTEVYRDEVAVMLVRSHGSRSE
jgi:hypothetical protein